MEERTRKCEGEEEWERGRKQGRQEEEWKERVKQNKIQRMVKEMRQKTET